MISDSLNQPDSKQKLIWNLCLLIFLTLCFSAISCAEETAKQAGTYEFEAEIDPYYSNIGWYFGLQDQPIPHVDNLSELEVYKQLVKESLTPDFLVVELSVNPLPYLGTVVKRSNSNMKGYQATIFRSLVEGFDEPYALSLFAGRVFRFDGPSDKNNSKNKGYIGYLISVGNQHIKDSVLISDNWLEIEWKVKGDRETDQQILSWGIHLGVKFHRHTDINDTFSLGFRRSRVDFISRNDAFFENIGFGYRYDMLQQNLKPSRHFLSIKKHFPIADSKTAISFEVGFIWEGARRYSGALLDKNAEGFTFIFRPNITF